MHCPHCNQEHPAGTLFCPLTGKKISLPAACPHCGKLVEQGWLYCDRCGQKLEQAQADSTPPAGSPQAPSAAPRTAKTRSRSPAAGWLAAAAGIGLLLVVALVVLGVFGKGIQPPQAAHSAAGAVTAVTATMTPTAANAVTAVTTAITPTAAFASTASSVPVALAGASGEIAFESSRDGNLEIYVMNADGSNQTRLTNNPASDGDPSWSPDGRKIAFVSNRDGNWEIYVMNADGSQQTCLSRNPADEAYPAWSPDGLKIAFTSNREGNLEIYVMDADGSHQTRLTNNKSQDSFPAWSPDGQKIAYQSFTEGIVQDYEIFVMNADGSAPTNISNSAESGDLYPSWSADGNKIAFISHRDPIWEIYVMNADGSGLIRLTHEEAGESYYEPDRAENGFPAWAKDVQQIAFVSARDGNAEIYVMNADGSQQTRLTRNEAYDSFPDWLPSAPVVRAAPTAEFTPTPVAESGATMTPFPGTPMVDTQIGIAFNVPPGIDLYSVENPGPLGSQLSSQEPYILVNPDFTDENVNIKFTDGMTEAMLDVYKQTLDADPSMPLPGYKNISVAFINIGKDGQIKAVEHLFQMQGNILGTMRSITFVIGTRGFTITCGTAVDRFEKANRDFFEPLLNSIGPVP